MTYWTLVSKAHPSLFKRLKYISKILVYKEKADELYKNFLKFNFEFLLTEHASIFSKPFRKYIFCNSKIDEKFTLINSHYSFLYKNFTLEMIKMVYLKYLSLIEFELEDIGKIKLVLSYVPSLGKEGELTLIMMLGNKEIYSIAFLFIEKNNKKEVIIGGIQSRNYVSLDMIRKITKKMHGIRPRNFLLFILREISYLLSIDIIKAVTSEEHVANCSNVRKTGKFNADYDLYWEEENGIKKGSFFILPLYGIRKSMEEIPSKKRSMYKKRYTMLDNFSNDIKMNFEKYLIHKE